MNYNKNDVEVLLGQVKTLANAYNIVKENTGENFNLFQILGMETAEVKTHSKFLAELLNPKGSHEQGDKFLSIFVNYLNISNVISEGYDKSDLLLENRLEFNSVKANVEVEKYIGKKTIDEGGRVDILITDIENRLICIENKIYADEQENQLLRYRNFGTKFNDCYLFFLTLEGNQCSTIPEDDGKRVYTISYKRHIIDWLELCKKEAVDFPILRETIGQYINLIKKLTHQTTNKRMEKDIQNMILNNFEESQIVFQNYENALINKFSFIIKGIAKRIETFLFDRNWEIALLDHIQNSKSRGMIWVKPQNCSNDWIIGLEDVNPLFGYHNFDHRIFIGVRAEGGMRDYYDKLTRDEREKNSGGWNDYIFIPDFQGLEVNTNNKDLLKSLANEKTTEDFIVHIFESFKEYFIKHEQLLHQHIMEVQHREAVRDVTNIGE